MSPRQIVGLSLLVLGAFVIGLFQLLYPGIFTFDPAQLYLNLGIQVWFVTAVVALLVMALGFKTRRLSQLSILATVVMMIIGLFYPASGGSTNYQTIVVAIVMMVWIFTIAADGIFDFFNLHPY